jgi:regulatory protein
MRRGWPTPEPAAFAALRERALGLLARREHGVRELERKLVAKGADRELVRAVIEELASRDLVSDERYAAAYARESIRRRPRAERRLVAELVERRVPAAIAARAVEAAFDEGGVDDRALALRLAQARAARMTDLPPDARWGRLGRFLHGRGFATALVAEACEQVLPSIEEEP